jgi:hypothetical protein
MTFSGKTPTALTTTGRPMACASAAARPVNGGFSAGMTTTSAAAIAVGMSGT